MVAPLSNDLREPVVATVGCCESCRSVAARLGDAVSSVVKWTQGHRAKGLVAPGKMGGRKRVLEPHCNLIVRRINQTCHLTLHGLKDELTARGVKVLHNTVWLFLRCEGLSLKKRCSLLSRLSPTSPVGGGDGAPGRLVFIDETWIKTNMAPLHGG